MAIWAYGEEKSDYLIGDDDIASTCSGQDEGPAISGGESGGEDQEEQPCTCLDKTFKFLGEEDSQFGLKTFNFLEDDEPQKVEIAFEKTFDAFDKTFGLCSGFDANHTFTATFNHFEPHAFLEQRQSSLPMPLPAYVHAAEDAAAPVQDADGENGNETAVEERVRRSGWPKRSKASEPSSDARTTVSLRNLPRRYTREMVRQLLDTKGFAGKYDFLYLPTDFKRMTSCGFAFVNMVSNDDAARLQDALADFNDWAIESEKAMVVTWAEVQVFSQHIQRYRNSPVMSELVPEEYKPQIFSCGCVDVFPPPTKKVRPPQFWRQGGC